LIFLTIRLKFLNIKLSQKI